MSMLDRIFGTPEERKVEGILKKVEAETSEVYGPLGNLSLGIVKATWDSYQDVARGLGFSVEGQPTEQQMLIFYELLYFFIHLTIRTAIADGLTKTQMFKLHDYLNLSLSQTAADTFWRHLPVEQKSRIAQEFLEKLNIAEADYSECRVFIVEDKPFEKDSLFGRLAYNVAQIWRSPSDPAVMKSALMAAAKVFTRMQLDNLIHDVAVVIDRVKPDTLAVLRDRPWS
ncbi:MAG TPA: hypothetical protein VII95_04405 [Terriglobales bacterium]|jgi:hypothetical protein